MATKYEKGRSFENGIRKKLEAKNFYVARSAASKGVFDLVAIPPVREGFSPPCLVLGIQCKAHGKVSKTEKQRIIETAKKYNLIPVLATKFNKRVILVNLETETLLEGL